MKLLKIRHIIALALTPFLLTACFSDDGNYDYDNIDPPTWLINVNTNFIRVSGVGGRQITLDASKYFTWGEDSLKRSEEVRYEWIYNGHVVSEQLKETMLAEDLLERMGLTDYTTEQPLNGEFHIIDKRNGITFMARVGFTIYAPISSGDFIIYAAKKGQEHVGKLSHLALYYDTDANGSLKENYWFRPDLSEDIPGTPKEIDIALAKNISPTGSVTAITQEGSATVFNGATLKKEWDLSSQFADGVPENFLVSARADQETSGTYPAFTWVATKDGRVFTRQTGKNWIGGKFLTEPYYLDEKGYKITKFGHGLWGITNIVCYDELNRRVVIATALPHDATNTYRSYMKVLTSSNWSSSYTPLMNMPEDAKVYHMTGMNSTALWDSNNSWYQIFYTTGGKSMVGTFRIDVRYRSLSNPLTAYRLPYEIKGHLFNDETVFLTAATTRFYRNPTYNQYDLFSEGTKIFAAVKQLSYGASGATVRIVQMPFEGITSKVTCMTYDRSDAYWAGGYKHLIVGCENGDVLVYDSQTLQQPKLVKKYNVGGRVASVKQLGVMRNTLDMY
ncbi:MAG: PKD-like family lipoprotein [Prevotella sp.]|nr:PKD-like family lipoprotein [Prevotella sp.]MDY4038829.1 PKD-like family lipoprotein [Prevotella sp.]